MIGLDLLLPLLTPTIWFSLYHKRNVSDGVVSGIVTLFSLDHKLYASDYDSDSDSVASENQPLQDSDRIVQNPDWIVQDPNSISYRILIGLHRILTVSPTES